LLFSTFDFKREKKFADFLGPLEYQKNKNFHKIFLKNTIEESCTKNIQFFTRRR